MKKSLLALAALTAFAGVASAQSSVTLFGVVDLNARGVDNGTGSRSTLSQDGNASSRLGFRGVEDLGGGLKAGFWLEAGVNPDIGGTNMIADNALLPTGTPASTAKSSQLFNRRSTLSLMGGFGEIRLGRDYTPTFWNHTVFDPFGTNGVGSQTNLQGVAGSAAQTLVRANNTIGYFLPSLGGLYGQAMYAMDEGANPGNEYVGGRIGYAAGPVNVAAAYAETKLPNTNLKAANIGASFNMGFMTLMGQYHEYKYGGNKQTNMMAGLVVPLGAGNLKFSYGQTELKTAAGKPKATQIAAGYVYDLSKRTAVYVHASQVDNDAGLAYTAGSGGKTNGAGGFKSTGYELGVRHSF